MKTNDKLYKAKNKEYTEEEIESLEEIKLKYETLLETIPYMAWFMDSEGKYQDINKEFVMHSGKNQVDIKGKGHKYAWELKVGNECEQNDLKVLEAKKTMIFKEIVPGEKGYKRFDIYRTPVIDNEGKILGIIAVGRDITEIKNKDKEFRTLIENIPFGVWQYDTKGNIVIANLKYAEFNSTDISQMIGKNIEDIYSKKYAKEISEENRKIIESKSSMKKTKKIYCEDKEKVVEIYKTPILSIGKEVIGIVCTMVDITEISKTKTKIKMQAYTDYNTKLLNRRALYEYLNIELKDKAKSVMILDIDNFKTINDTYGHYTGDKLLLKVSQSLKNMNEDNRVFRFGGDEFLVVYDKKLDKDTLIDKAEEVLNEISKISIGNESISVSIGMASCGCENTCEKCGMCEGKCEECRLIIKADMALYSAKDNKKNGYVVFTKELKKQMIFMANLEKDLKNVIDNDEVKLVYQPQYTSEGEISGFEALFRWNNEKYNEVPVYKLIEIMEKNKSIISIGNEIAKKSCEFAKKINKDRKDNLVVSFNVSAVQIMSNKFIDSIKNILKETDVSPKHIAIEITESIIFEDMDKSISTIKELKDLGIKIALDDFGTGYSSFNYLVKLPLSTIKIDKSFSMEMDKYKEYINLIKLIVDASHSLNLDVVAEGVETKEQLNVLRIIGVEYMQGYLFSKPLEEEDAIKIINVNNKKNILEL